MRFVSTILVVFIFACLLLAQAPIGFGPGTLTLGLLDYFDWYTATPSGCSTAQGANGGPRGMCVGGLPNGDTMWFTGWFADSSLLPIKTGLPLVGTANDFVSKTCGGNLMVFQLAEFDWAARNASRMYEINCMSGYGTAPGASDAPAGWKGHCTSNDDGTQGCSWKSRGILVRNGILYYFVERQIPAGTPSIHDATLIKSEDGGQTWKNPYTVAHSGTASATGDAPTCGAAASGAGNPCTVASYPGSIMWPAMPTTFDQWIPVQYNQDGAVPPSGITDGCDPAIYTCFFGVTEGTLARVLNTDLPSLDATKYRYYTCPAISDTYRCPGSNSASWTATFADRTQIIPTDFWAIAYLKEFKSYVAGPGTGKGLFWAPTMQGPWTNVLTPSASAFAYSMMPLLGLGYTVVSTNPPHVKLTTGGDSHFAHSGNSDPRFCQYDAVLGKTPMLLGGENPRYTNVGGVAANSGIIFSDGHAAGTMPQNGLEVAYDFYDHGGNVSAGIAGFHDIGNGGSFLVPCWRDAGQKCYFASSKGASLTTFGAQMYGGYSPFMTTVMHDTPQTVAIGLANSTTGGYTLQNAPASMQGNGSYTVAGVFRIDSGSYNVIWSTGDASSSNTAVNLTGWPTLQLNWGVLGSSWRFNSAFTPTTGDWYFMSVTVAAHGTTPVAHIWTGIGGTLIDEIAGVSRAALSGSPTPTPNVSATPLTLAYDLASASWGSVSYAGLYVYNRALGQAEVGLMYQTMKKNMAARGVTLQ